MAGLLALLYPPKCPFCQKLLEPGEELICASCRPKLPWTTEAGGRTVGRFFSRCVSPLYYTDTAREALLRFKFGSRISCAAAFGSLIAERLSREKDLRYDLVTWIPSSFLRIRHRGYSQSRLLAEETAKRLGEECTALLRRRAHRVPQSRMRTEADRIANVSGAFRAVHPERFVGKRVLLIDDVVTTGATLSECARVLLGAGAEDVVCAALCCRPHRR